VFIAHGYISHKLSSKEVIQQGFTLSMNIFINASFHFKKVHFSEKKKKRARFIKDVVELQEIFHDTTQTSSRRGYCKSRRFREALDIIKNRARTSSMQRRELLNHVMPISCSRGGCDEQI
jgi:hypothetical protein